MSVLTLILGAVATYVWLNKPQHPLAEYVLRILGQVEDEAKAKQLQELMAKVMERVPKQPTQP